MMEAELHGLRTGISRGRPTSEHAEGLVQGDGRPPGDMAMPFSAAYPLFYRFATLATMIVVLTVLVLALSLSHLRINRDAMPAQSIATGIDASMLSTASMSEHTIGLWLQVACSIALLTIVCALLLHAWRAFIRDPERVMTRLRMEQPGLPADEIDRLALSSALIARSQTEARISDAVRCQAQSELSAGQTRVVLCLHQVAERLVGAPVSEFALLKALGVLSEALDVATVGLRLSTRTSAALHSEALLTLHGIPMALTDSGEAVQASTYVALHRASDGRSVRCLSVPLRRGEETIAVLAVEAPEVYDFDEGRIKLTQTVAMMMALSLSGLSQGQEERRGALLAERAAIARELHDSLAQSLAFLKIQVAQMQVVLRDGPTSNAATSLAQQLRQGISHAYIQVKELISAFRVRMGTRGLGQALEEAAEEFGDKGGFAIASDFRLHDCKLTVNEEFHVLQVIREALSNIVRHARASNVTVTLSHIPGGLVTVTVEDDGRGFAPNTDRPAHYGLTIMQERAASLCGQLTVTAREEGGTRVLLVFAPEATVPGGLPRRFA